jgi:hypothetical protein
MASDTTTNSTELCPTWKTFSGSATEEFSNICYNPKVHYRVRKNPQLVAFLSQMNPVHTTTSYLSKICFNIILPPTSRYS